MFKVQKTSEHNNVITVKLSCGKSIKKKKVNEKLIKIKFKKYI